MSYPLLKGPVDVVPEDDQEHQRKRGGDRQQMRAGKGRRPAYEFGDQIHWVPVFD